MDPASLRRRRRPQPPEVDHLTSLRALLTSQTIGDYRTTPVGLTRSRLIGKGAAGTVTVRHDLIQNKAIAVKHFSSVSDTRIFLREVDIMVKLNHPCVLRILKWALPEHSTEGEIHTEFAPNGSLKSLLADVNAGQKPAFWNPTGIGILICSIVLAMRYIHSRRIIHHDLKPSNILINAKEYVWICDFGVSHSEDDVATFGSTTGTLRYAAPEQFEESAICTTKCDVFTVGLILYEILAGTPVFSLSEPHLVVMSRLRDMDLPDVPSGHGELMRSLIGHCWKHDPGQRPSFAEIFDQFTLANFEILPGVDRRRIRDFVNSILNWESRSRMAVIGYRF
jgi:serine/threonine protein kinase